MQDRQNQGRKNHTGEWRQYCRYILHQRDAQLHVPFSFSRLFQQFLVDMWAVNDQLKLEWLRHNQKKLRSDLYTGVQDWLRDGDGDGNALGQRTILPSTYLGGQRFVAQCYQDSMAIVRFLGPPTFFITVTANPNWPEVLRELRPGEKASDRPDIVGRIFNLKCNAIIAELKAGLFGAFAGDVWTVEYQKRGLPHRHILLFLILDVAALHRDPRNFDRVICAEIPSAPEFCEK